MLFRIISLVVSFSAFLNSAQASDYAFKVAKSTRLNTGIVLKESDLLQIVQRNAPYLNSRIKKDASNLSFRQMQLDQFYRQFQAPIKKAWAENGASPKRVHEDIKAIIENESDPIAVYPKIIQKYGPLYKDLVKRTGLDSLSIANQILKIAPPPKQAKKILPIWDPSTPSLFSHFIGAGWFAGVIHNIPPPTGITHDYRDFSIVGIHGGEGLPDPSGAFDQWSLSAFAGATTITSLFANVFETDSRTRQIRAEFDFTQLEVSAAAAGGLGWADAGARIRVSVLDGTTPLCSRDEQLAMTSSFLAGPAIEGNIPTLQINCTFDSPLPGAPIRLVVLVEVVNWSGAGGLFSIARSDFSGEDIDLKIYEVF